MVGISLFFISMNVSQFNVPCDSYSFAMFRARPKRVLSDFYNQGTCLTCTICRSVSLSAHPSKFDINVEIRETPDFFLKKRSNLQEIEITIKRNEGWGRGRGWASFGSSALFKRTTLRANVACSTLTNNPNAFIKKTDCFT